MDCGLKEPVWMFGKSLKQANELRTFYSLPVHSRLLQVREDCLLQGFELDPLYKGAEQPRYHTGQEPRGWESLSWNAHCCSISWQPSAPRRHRSYIRAYPDPQAH